jgi:serine phosphatase RsbU (regulator of sigma subunit)
MRTSARLLGDPVAAIAELNQALGADERLSVCTVVAVLLEERAQGVRASVVCAGHPQPLLVRGGAVTPVGRWGVMVGAWADAAWEAVPVDLEPGDMLVLYTDGVTDARGAGARFGEPRLRAAVAPAADPRDAVARIGAALDAFEAGSQADDTAVLAVMRTGPGTP